MGKTVAYLAAAVVFIGIGALVAGLSLWYHHPNIKEKPIEESRYAQCDLKATGVGGAVNGTLYLEQFRSFSPVLINGNITGLAPRQHGFHVHQWGVNGAQNRCKDAGGHYNPFGYNHSAPNATERHVGDLGNVLAINDGRGGTITTVDITDNILTLWGHYSIAGRAIVVHEGQDDLGTGGDSSSLKTGNAGGRVACCTVYFIQKPTK